MKIPDALKRISCIDSKESVFVQLGKIYVFVKQTNKQKVVYKVAVTRELQKIILFSATNDIAIHEKQIHCCHIIWYE